MAALIYAAQARDCPYEIVLVASDRSDAAGLDLAQAEGISTVRLTGGGNKAALFEELQQALQQANVELIALAGFMRIIPAEFVARWAGKMLNIHPSLLPKYKGLRTHEACLAAGDRKTGATVHLVTPELDSGEILGQVEVAVLPGDTPETLGERVLIAEHQLYPRVLADYAARPFSTRSIDQPTISSGLKK